MEDYSKIIGKCEYPAKILNCSFTITEADFRITKKHEIEFLQNLFRLEGHKIKKRHLKKRLRGIEKEERDS